MGILAHFATSSYFKNKNPYKIRAKIEFVIFWEQKPGEMQNLGKKFYFFFKKIKICKSFRFNRFENKIPEKCKI